MFYKNEKNILIKGGHIDGPGYSLAENARTKYVYPVNGWYWFASDAEAYSALGIVAPVAVPDECKNCSVMLKIKTAELI